MTVPLQEAEQEVGWKTAQQAAREASWEARREPAREASREARRKAVREAACEIACETAYRSLKQGAQPIVEDNAIDPINHILIPQNSPYSLE